MVTWWLVAPRTKQESDWADDHTVSVGKENERHEKNHQQTKSYWRYHFLNADCWATFFLVIFPLFGSYFSLMNHGMIIASSMVAAYFPLLITSPYFSSFHDQSPTSHRTNAVLLCRRHGAFLAKERHLPIGHQAPVFHGASSEIWDGNHVLSEITTNPRSF